MTAESLCISIIIVNGAIGGLGVLWIDKDAKSRGANYNFWGIIMAFAFLLPFIGYGIVFVVWLLIRPPIKFNSELKPGEKEITDSEWIPIETYHPFLDKDRICPDCNRKIPFDANYCPYCLKKFRLYH